MSELEERINSILASPEEMGRLMQMAQSILGGAPQEEPQPKAEETFPGLNAGMMGKLAGLLGGAQAPVSDKSDKLALIEAMQPFFGEKRRKKMSRALQIAKAARIAGVLFAENGGDGDL